MCIMKIIRLWWISTNVYNKIAMLNIMGNNMLIATEVKHDYVSAISKIANSALLTKAQCFRQHLEGKQSRLPREWPRWHPGKASWCLENTKTAEWKHNTAGGLPTSVCTVIWSAMEISAGCTSLTLFSNYVKLQRISWHPYPSIYNTFVP